MDVFTVAGQDFVIIGGQQYKATRLFDHAANTVGLATTATLAAAVNELTYITGFDCQWDSTGVGTVAGSVNIAGTALANFFFKLVTIAGAGGSIGPIMFPFPIPASAVNTAITVSLPLLANRAGGSVHAYGFRVPSP